MSGLANGVSHEAALHDAVDAWIDAKRALERAMPWTADWLRLRMIEQDRRAAYLSLMDRRPDAEDELGTLPDSVERAPA